PGLGQTYRVHLYQEPSHRGTNVDRLGRPLALDAQLRQVGVVPQYIAHEKSLLAFLSGWLHKHTAQIRTLYHVSWAVRNPPDFQYTIATIKERAVQNGATIRLTLDATLQAAAEKALAGKVGAVVALRPSNGAVLAMASAPGYDPNGFVTGLTPAQYHALVASPHAPLINHATMGQYPPGSIFKIVAMGAALEQGSYTATTRMAGPPVWYAPRPTRAMHDWNPAGHGVISLHEALVQSCDTCFYQL